MTAARFAWISAAVFAVSLVVVLGASVATGPSFAEVARVTRVRNAEALVLGVAKEGLGALTKPEARRSLEDAGAFGAPTTLFGSYASLLAAERGAEERLTAMRAGWLGVVATAPLALFWIAELGFGVATAVLAAALLLCMPSFLHAAAVASPDAVLAGIWTLSFATYVRSLRGRRALCWAAACAVVLGAGLAIDLAALWAVVPIVIHFTWIRRRHLRRALARGRLPVPGFVLLALVLAPAVLGALSPQIWRAKPPGLVEWALGSLDVPRGTALYRGAEVTAGSFYAVERWLASVPLLVFVLAGVGVVLIVRAPRVESRDGAGRAVGVRAGVVALAVVVLAVVLVVLPLMPGNVGAFPPRIVAALPPAALLAAVGLERVSRQTVSPRWAVLAGVVVSLLFVSAARQLSTAGAYFSVLAGGVGRVVERRIFEPGDGSELSPLVQAIDAEGRDRASVYAPDVPDGYFEMLRGLGRARTELSLSKSARRADFSIVRGSRDGALASVERGGAVLWSLTAGGR